MQPGQDNGLSERLYDRAIQHIPGGVNSPVRSFKSVGKHPLFAARGQGCRLWDVDGNSYIDYVMSYGPLIFGHASPDVVEAIKAAADLGTTFGASTFGEVELAELMCAMVPSLEKVRLVSSGTEAVMSAIRVARGFTGRDKVVKFEGCYHGHSDSLLAKAGSGVATLALPDSSGVPANLTRDTIVLPYNDIDSFVVAMRANGAEVAAVIVEPVAANMGVVLPKPGFLEALREWTTRTGSILIFDEIITGFRLAAGGAQELFGITPDMTTLGKIAGGGLPLAAYGGRAEIMDVVAPVGSVYQAGTLSGNPLAVAAGLTVLRRIQADPTILLRLDDATARLTDAVAVSVARGRVPVTLNRIGSIVTLFFADGPVTDFSSAASSNREQYARFFAEIYRHGVLTAPSQFEAMFLSTAHSDDDLALTADVIGSALAKLNG
jgi:glutamate-1-semialdehyde 2,1-aminomutase